MHQNTFQWSHLLIPYQFYLILLLPEMKIELSPTVPTIHREIMTTKKRRGSVSDIFFHPLIMIICRRKGRKKDRHNNKRIESEDLENWDGGIDAFVPFEEKDKFEEIENKVATFTYSMPTERVSSEYRNSWRSSRASPTYPNISLNLLITSLSLLISIFCSATSLIVWKCSSIGATLIHYLPPCKFT